MISARKVLFPPWKKDQEFGVAVDAEQTLRFELSSRQKSSKNIAVSIPNLFCRIFPTVLFDQIVSQLESSEKAKMD